MNDEKPAPADRGGFFFPGDGSPPDFSRMDPARFGEALVAVVRAWSTTSPGGEEFDARAAVEGWLDDHVPALGCRPRSLLATAEGRKDVFDMFLMALHGSYA
jgi:hypothetical protein